MFARGKLVAAVAVGCLTLIAGCEERRTTMKVAETDGVTSIPKHSGYTAGPSQWTEFLQCWKAAFGDRLASLPEDERDGILQRSALNRGRLHDRGATSGTVEEVERLLGVRLPTSYRDFLQAYEPGVAARPLPNLRESVGLFAPAEVALLKNFDPEVIKLVQKYPIETADAEYFTYGIGQDETSGRVRYYGDAIIVGKYGSALFERIVLYPQVRTSDGEMEGALHSHSGEFRAPSFAELMRQLSYLETKGPDRKSVV